MRARLYADVEAEREARGKRAATPPPEEQSHKARELGEARRRDIAREVEGYLTPPPKALPTPAPSASTPSEPEARVPPSPPFRWDEEMRFLLYVAIGVSVVAAVVASVVLYQG